MGRYDALWDGVRFSCFPETLLGFSYDFMRFSNVIWRLLVLVLAVSGGGRAMAEGVRLWTSTAGTSLQAEYLATVNGQIWLRDTAGRVLKVDPGQLVASDRSFLGDAAVVRSVLRARRLEPQALAMLEVLASVDVPTYHVNEVSLQDAFDRLSDVMAKAAPDQPRVRFDLGELGNRTGVSVLLRKRPGVAILAFLCQAYGLEVRGQMVDGRLVVRLRPLGGESEEESAPKTGPQWEPPPAQPQLPPVQTERSGPVVWRDEAPTGSVPVCSASTEQANLVRESGFEQASSRWVMTNRKNSFRRVDAAEFTSWGDGSRLGNKVMMVKATAYDSDRSDGPPYITQELSLPLGAKRIRICCDLAYEGDLIDQVDVRLSVTNPEMRYVQGGKTFPFTRVSPFKTKEWRHCEWVVDVSGMGSRRLVLGCMFPFFNHAWYIDNVKVTVVAP